LLQALAGVGTYGVILPFSRSHESEADEIGLFLAAEAGYDPRAAITLWQRMAASAKGAKPPEFLSTHPSESTRIERLQELMPQAVPIYEAAKAGAQR
jgi:predicted Zn-dependent protease